jgi:hypothetical protein
MPSEPSSLLGPTPWRIDTKRLAKERRNARLLAAFFAVFGLFMVWPVSEATRETWQDYRVWRSGAPGQVLDYSGNERTRGPLGIPVFNEYTLDVTYTDAQGQQHEGEAKFDRLFVGVDNEAGPEVRVDPADPSRFVLSWAVELPRWLSALVFLLMPLVIGLAAVGLLRTERRRRELVHLCAEDGQEQLLPLESVSEHKGTHKVSFMAGDKKHTETLKRAPHLVERGGRQHVVVLRSPRAPGLLLVLEDDYSPFFPPTELPASLEADAAKKTGT